jgi:uncharacterized membrane protein
MHVTIIIEIYRFFFSFSSIVIVIIIIVISLLRIMTNCSHRTIANTRKIMKETTVIEYSFPPE